MLVGLLGILVAVVLFLVGRSWIKDSANAPKTDLVSRSRLEWLLVIGFGLGLLGAFLYIAPPEPNVWLSGGLVAVGVGCVIARRLRFGRWI